MDLTALMDGNVDFAKRFSQGQLPINPRFSTLVLTCLDARVDPGHFLGLQLGDAFVMRNVGGRVTNDVIDQIAILRALAVVFGSGTPLELAIIHHTDCGTNRFTDAAVRTKLADAAGIGEQAIEALAITDPAISVAEDIERLRAAPNVPDDLVVGGYVYDVTDGQAREVRAPGPLGP